MKSTSLWRQITNFEGFSKEIQEVANKGIRVKVGNGALTRFWDDIWIGDYSLKSLFPRLFGLSTQKDDFIINMGVWYKGEWSWRLKWRRKLFAWEEDLVGDLMLAVNQYNMKENSRDVIVWSGDKSSSFLVSNFVLQVYRHMAIGSHSSDIGREAWKNIAPPRAQLHLWFLLHGRINTKDRLFRHGIQGVEDDRCALCKEERETIEHLFFSCKFSSSLWYFCCSQWGISYCIPNHAMANLLSWRGTTFTRFDMKSWLSMFYIITWTIWDIRDKIVFQGLNPK